MSADLELEEARLGDLADEIDLILLRRDKLAILVARLRNVHRKLTRTQVYRPTIRQGDTHLDQEYVRQFEAKPWQAKPRSYRRRGIDDNPKGLWRKAKLPW